MSRRSIDEGAWTRMRLKTRSCRVSKDGEFWVYVAEGGVDGPFSAVFGGACAVARVPWLAALTDMEPFSVAGGGKSKHALSAKEQESLWEKFKGTPWWANEANWPQPLGPAWRRASASNYGTDRVPLARSTRRTRLVGCARVPKRNLQVVVISDRTSRDSHESEVARYYLESSSVRGGPLRELVDVVWAMPLDDGTIATADSAGSLQRVFPKAAGDPHSPFKLVEEHDVSDSTPNPRAAPKWATAGL